MVLLDSTAPKPGPARQPTPSPTTVSVASPHWFSTVAHLGVGRLIAQGSYGSLPPGAQDEARANASTARNLASFIKEFLAEANTAMQQASSLTTLDGKPLIVVTADKGITD